MIIRTSVPSILLTIHLLQNFDTAAAAVLVRPHGPHKQNDGAAPRTGEHRGARAHPPRRELHGSNPGRQAATRPDTVVPPEGDAGGLTADDLGYIHDHLYTFADVTDQYAMPEFQCAAEYSSSKYGCKDCHTNTTIQYDGIVKFGYGHRWTNWTVATPGMSCDAQTFGADPYPGNGKVCICRPRVYMCATEWSHQWANCTQCGNYRKTCSCVGQARIGYANTWSDWKDVNGTVSCSTREFGDPYPGQGKVCQCQPASLYADSPAYAYSETSNDWGAVLPSIVTITLTYFVVYMSLACVRTNNQMKNLQGPSAMERILETAATSCVYFAPMLCAVFFAVSKRADTLTAGHPLQYGLPPDWLQYAVGICSVTFLMQTFCYVIAEYCASQGSDGNERALVRPRSMRTINCWRLFCNMFTSVMYVALAVVMLGVVFMEEPQAVIFEQGKTPVRAGTAITLVLAVVYFGVYLMLHVFRNQELSQGSSTAPFGFEVMKLAATAMNFAPMLCILFLGSQIAGDWSGQMLPPKVARWMYVCLYSLLLQVVLVVVAPWLAGAELQVVGSRGEVDFVTRNHEVFVCISVVRWIAMFVLYVGIVIIISTLWSAGVTPMLTHELFRFSALYFLAYLILWAAITARQFTGGGYIRAIRVLSVAKDTVVFCPMLSALYLSSFVRAHRFINQYGNQGVPQSYVQDWMVVSSVALTAMLLMVIFVGFSSQKSGMEERAPAGYMFCYHVAMVVLFISVLVVIQGLFTINEKNADVAGAWFA